MWSLDVNKQDLKTAKWTSNHHTTLHPSASDASLWRHTNPAANSSGWGSVNHSPVPNAGTESWGNNPPQILPNSQASNNEASNKLLNSRPTPGLVPNFKNSNISNLQQNNTWASKAGPTSAWSRGKPVTCNQAFFTSKANQPLSSSGPSSWADAVANKHSSIITSTTNTTVTSEVLNTNTEEVTTSTEATSAEKLREEKISAAINSNEGWGKKTIRQDTAWVVNEVIHEDEQPQPNQLTSKQVITGTAIWESLKSKSSDVLWDSKMPPPSDPFSNPSYRPPFEKLPWASIDNNTPSWAPGNLPAKVPEGAIWPTKKEEVSWGGAENKNEPGWNNNLHRSASTGSWSEHVNGGWVDENKDNGTSLWNDKGWRGKNKMEGDVFSNHKNNIEAWTPMNQEGWGEPSWAGPRFKAANWNEEANIYANRLQPQRNLPPLQKIMNFGFKREEAHSALLSHNMNVEETLAWLIRSKSQGETANTNQNSGDSSLPSSSSSLRFNNIRGDGMFSPRDPSFELMNLQLNDTALNNNLANANPLNRLKTPNNINNNLNNKNNNNMLLQQFISSLDNNSNLLGKQPQPLMQQLLQTIQAVVSSGLLPMQAITPASLANPSFFQNLQHLLRLHDAHQKISQQSIHLLPSQQQCALETATSLQHRIDALKTQLIQTAVSQPLSPWKPDKHSSVEFSNLNPLLPPNLTTPSSLWQPTTSTTAAWSSNDKSPVSSTTNTTSTTTTSLETSSAPLLPSTLEIEEFVPGKLWQGPSQKTVEDDPYLTPGSINHYTKPNSSLSSKADTRPVKLPPWSDTGPPPEKGTNWGGLHRSVSWASGDQPAGTNNTMVSSPGLPSNWILLKGIPQQLDSSTVQSLCQGSLVCSQVGGGIDGSRWVVGFAKVDDAVRVAKQLRGSPFKAEFISESDASNLTRLQHMSPFVPNMLNNAPFNNNPPPFLNNNNLPPFNNANMPPFNNNNNNNKMMMNDPMRPWTPSMMSSSSVWPNRQPMWSVDDQEHASAFLPGDLLGGQ